MVFREIFEPLSYFCLIFSDLLVGKKNNPFVSHNVNAALESKEVHGFGKVFLNSMNACIIIVCLYVLYIGHTYIILCVNFIFPHGTFKLSPLVLTNFISIFFFLSALF